MVRELKRLQHEELNGRRSLELQGAQDPSKSGLQLPRFKLGLIDQDTEEYDERVSESIRSGPVRSGLFVSSFLFFFSKIQFRKVVAAIVVVDIGVDVSVLFYFVFPARMFVCYGE